MSQIKPGTQLQDEDSLEVTGVAQEVNRWDLIQRGETNNQDGNV